MAKTTLTKVRAILYIIFRANWLLQLDDRVIGNAKYEGKINDMIEEIKHND